MTVQERIAEAYRQAIAEIFGVSDIPKDAVYPLDYEEGRLVTIDTVPVMAGIPHPGDSPQAQASWFDVDTRVAELTGLDVVHIPAAGGIVDIEIR